MDITYVRAVSPDNGADYNLRVYSKNYKQTELNEHEVSSRLKKKITDSCRRILQEEPKIKSLEISVTIPEKI